MLEQALIDAINHLRTPPAIIRTLGEIEGPLTSTAEFSKRMDKAATFAEDEMRAWLKEGESARAELSRLFAAGLKAGLNPETTLPKFDERLAQIELSAIRTAREADEIAQAMKKQLRNARRFGPSVEEAFRSVHERMFRIMEREMEERGDFLLFMKAWAARFKDDGAPSPSFSDPKQLERYLKAALVAG